MLFFPHNEDRESTGILTFDAGVLTEAGIKRLVRDMYKRIHGIGDAGIDIIRVLWDNSLDPDPRYTNQYPTITLDQERKNKVRNELGISLDALNTQLKGMKQCGALKPVRKKGHTKYHICVPHPDAFPLERLDGVQINFTPEQS